MIDGKNSDNSKKVANFDLTLNKIVSLGIPKATAGVCKILATVLPNDHIGNYFIPRNFQCSLDGLSCSVGQLKTHPNDENKNNN